MDAAAWEWCNSLGCRPESVPDLVTNRDKYEAVWDAVMEALEAVNKVRWESSLSHLMLKYLSLTRFH